ncbi:MAG: hypothetical protein ACFFC7_23975 [Candidatus Hermodarchaeota archaeon]
MRVAWRFFIKHVCSWFIEPFGPPLVVYATLAHLDHVIASTLCPND